MVVLLAGASGLLGSALRQALSAREVRQLVRRPAAAAHEVTWNPMDPLPSSVLEGVSAVINLGGAGVGDKRWTASRLAHIRDTRVIPTRTLALAIARHQAPVRYLQASAVGIYGDTGERVTDEAAPVADSPLAAICQQWEAAAGAVPEAALLRTGIVLSPAGGALAPIRRLLKLGVGGRMGSGQQWWPWIHIDDWVAAVRFLLDQPAQRALHGPVNLTAPAPARNIEVINQLAAALKRPAVIPAPAFALRAALGGFSEEILQSQRVVPGALTAAGFRFTYPDIASAAHALT